jgi:hypothetical protein
MGGMPCPTPNHRWYHVTPARFFLGLLVVQVFLLLSARFQWFPFNEHKGWTVLIAVGVVGLAVLLMLLWGLVCLCRRRRFQFGVRSLLLFVVAVSVPLGWFAWEMEKARRQREAVERIVKAGGKVYFDYEWDEWRGRIRGGDPTTSAWLRRLFGDDFFRNVVLVNGGFRAFGDNEAKRLWGLLNDEPHWLPNGIELERCRAVIESRFGSQLSLIKSKSIELDESDPEMADRIHKELQLALSIPEVFAASWSSDGHHGLENLVSAGAEEWGWHLRGVISRSPDGLHTLYVGESDDGARLLVFEGMVPNGTKRVFRIAFRYERVAAETTP